MLLARIYEVFPLRCPRCGEPIRLIAFVTDSGSITRILAYLGEPTKAPHVAPAARGPPREKDFEPRQGTDLSEPLPEVEFDQRVSWWRLPSCSCRSPHLDSYRRTRVQAPDTTPKTHP